MLSNDCYIIAKLNQVEFRHREATVSEPKHESQDGQGVGPKRQRLRRARKGNLVRIRMRRRDFSYTRASTIGELKVDAQLAVPQRKRRLAERINGAGNSVDVQFVRVAWS